MDTLLEAVRSKVVGPGVFDRVALEDGKLRCAAKGAGAEAWYRIEREGGTLYVSLVTPDRWLSESIEADLMHYGDPIEELIEEELVEQGEQPTTPVVQHYRSEDMMYTFRTPIPQVADEARQVEIAARYLLAYEAAFRELGDMTAEEEDETSAPLPPEATS